MNTLSMYRLLFRNLLLVTLKDPLNVPSLLQCGSKCLSSPDCVSFFYHRHQRTCFLLDDVVDQGGPEIVAADEVVYFVNRAAIICPLDKGYLLNPSLNICFKLNWEPMSFYPARQQCIKEGGDLVALKTPQIEEFFMTLLKTYQTDMFLGGTSEGSPGVWRWLDGTPWTTFTFNDGIRFCLEYDDREYMDATRCQAVTIKMFRGNHREVERQQRRRGIKFAGAVCLVLIDVFERQERERQVEHDGRKKKTRKTRRLWVREWLSRRPDYGQYHQLLTELHREDIRGYKNLMRITPDMFHEIVERLTPYLKKKATFMRQPLEVGLKLATTLRFLANGDSYQSLQYGFRVHVSTICKFIPEVCQAIVEVYKPEVLVCPKNPEEWKHVAEGFSTRWNYHNCLGALVGKHVALKKPPSAGSFYYNYKHFHSIVLMALVDSGYKFLYLDVGAEG